MDPVVSVLMPVYNGASFLPAALESLLSQTFTRWELVVVDDGSTDGTPPILAAAAARDSRIRVRRNPANLGLGATLQQAMAAAVAPFCGRLDADDVALESWLAERIQFLEQHPACVAVSGSRALMSASGNVLRRLDESLTSREAAWGLNFGNPIVHPSAVFRRAAAVAVGGYPPYRYLEDWSLFRRLAQAGEVVQDSAIRLKYRVHGNSTSFCISKSRGYLEPIVDSILAAPELESIESGLRRRVKWTLFRGRSPIRETKEVVAPALRYLCTTFRDFSGRVGSRPSPRISALFLRDVRNVVSAGPYCPRQVREAVGLALAVARRSGGVSRYLVREWAALVRDRIASRFRHRRHWDAPGGH